MEKMKVEDFLFNFASKLDLSKKKESLTREKFDKEIEEDPEMHKIMVKMLEEFAQIRISEKECNEQTL